MLLLGALFTVLSAPLDAAQPPILVLERAIQPQVATDGEGGAAYPALAAGGGVVGLVFEARKNGESVAFRRLR